MLIYDKLCQLTRYRGISPALDRAIDFVLTTDLSTLSSGRIDIDGDVVYGNHFSYRTAPYSPGSLFEAHQKYLDLHIVIQGNETVAVTSTEKLEQKEVRASEDAVLYTGLPDYTLNMDADHFILLFPEEGHLPKLTRGEPSQVNKLVLKVLISS